MKRKISERSKYQKLAKELQEKIELSAEMSKKVNQKQMATIASLESKNKALLARLEQRDLTVNYYPMLKHVQGDEVVRELATKLAKAKQQIEALKNEKASK